MPRFSPYLSVASLLLGSALFYSSAQAASAPTTSIRTLSGSIPNSTSLFRSLGILGSKGSVSRTRVLPAAKSPAKNTQAARSTAATAGALNVEFDSAYPSSARDILRPYFTANYNRMVLFYGAPAAEQLGKTVTVRYREGDPTAAYEPLLNSSATSAGTIYFKYIDSDSKAVNCYNFCRLVLLAFQGPNTFSYDYKNGNYVEAWQNGFADAAALMVAYNGTETSQRPSFDPSQLGTYVLPVYDFLNQPELGNAYIYSRIGTDLVIADFRAAMAQAAWLKVLVEDPLFFAKFNAEYYKRPARSAVNPDELRDIAAKIHPTVEGLSFTDWIRRQYVLDTKVTTGQKLYTAILPLPIDSTSDTRAGFQGLAEAFTTDSSGDEVPSTGYGSVSAFDKDGNNINSKSAELSASTLLDFNKEQVKYPGQARFGAGFSGIAAGRVTLKLRYLGAESSAVFPFISSGALTKLTYYGVTSNGDSGSIAITPNNGSLENATVTGGAWAGNSTYVSGPGVVTSLKLGERTFVRNTAWLAAGDQARGTGFILDGAATSTSFTLKPASGASALRMISLPFFPTESDESTILSTPVAQLTDHLAHYRPNVAPGTLKDGAITFGVIGDRHELYPYISGPMAPGRGYWLSADAAAQRTIKGTALPLTKPYEVPVLGGWNQIGVPFNRAFDVEAIKVRYGGFSTVSLANAILNGWVRPGIWKWQPGGGYARVDGVVGAKVEPFEGYYIYAVPERGVSLVFDPNASSEPTAATAGWTVSLTAASSSTRDASNRFGVSSLIPAAKPPAAEQAVTLHFLTSGTSDSDKSGAGAASGWADSFVPDLGREGIWDFVVDGTKKGERATLSWGDLKGVPADIKLVVGDKKLASHLRLTSGGSYKWTSEGKPRAFTLRASRIAIPTLRVDLMPSNVFNFGVTLNVEANGRLVVQNSVGDTITVLKNGSFATKMEKFSWNGRQSDGKLAPAGRYLVVWIPESADDKTASRSFNLK